MHSSTVVGLLAGALTLAQALSPTSSKDPLLGAVDERFDDRFSAVRTIRSMVSIHTVLCRGPLTSTLDTAWYVGCLDSLMQLNFVHGYSSYTFGDNYLAYLLGRWVWADFGAIVIPDDIMRQSRGACSQQAIAFLEVLRRQGFRVRGVRLKSRFAGHFAAAVYYGGAWRFYDTNLEAWSDGGVAPAIVAGRIDSTDLRRIYARYLQAHPHYTQALLSDFTNVQLLPEGEYRGRRMELAHHLTWFLSWFGCPLLLGFALGLRALRHVARLRQQVHVQAAQVLAPSAS